MNGRTPFLLRSYTIFLNITLKSKSDLKKQKQKENKLKSISYKAIQKTLSYFLKVSEVLTCPDTESFLGGVQVQSFVVYLFFSKGEWDHYQCSYETYTQQPKRATIGPPAKRHLKSASLEVRWWPDIGSFVLFQRFQTSIPEESYSFFVFPCGRGWSGPPKYPLLWIRAWINVLGLWNNVELAARGVF